jgi:outer membrane protein assembly factor BamB
MAKCAKAHVRAQPSFVPKNCSNMKYATLFFILIFVLNACREKTEEISPCEGVATDTTRLSLRWSKPLIGVRKPIVIGDNVLALTRNSGTLQSDLHCFDVLTGDLRWQRTLPTFLLGYDDVYVEGSTLYYVDEQNATLRSFDTNSLENKQVCAFDPALLVGSHFALGKGYAVCVASDYRLFSSGGGVDCYAYLVDLQSGGYREVYHSRIPRVEHLQPFNAPLTEITADGDTLVCFIENACCPLSGGPLNRFTCLNVSKDTLAFTRNFPFSYFGGYEDLSLHDGRAYFFLGDSIFCADARTASVFWSRPYSHNQDGLAFLDGNLLVFNGVVIALDASTGELQWRSSYIGTIEAPLVYLQNSQLYLIGDHKLLRLDW